MAEERHAVWVTSQKNQSPSRPSWLLPDGSTLNWNWDEQVVTLRRIVIETDDGFSVVVWQEVPDDG